MGKTDKRKMKANTSIYNGVSVGVEPSRDCKSLSLDSFKVMRIKNLKFVGVAIKQQQQQQQQTNKQRNRDLLCCEATDALYFALSR